MGAKSASEALTTSTNQPAPAWQQVVMFFHGDKGGVGKSTTCMAQADLLLKQGQPILIVDCDDRNPDVGRVFGDAVPVAQYSLRAETGWMELVDLIDANPDKHVLISLPAGIGAHCAQHFALFSEGVKRVPEGRLPPKVWIYWVLNHYVDSVNLLGDQINALNSSVDRWIVVRNLSAADGTPEAFFIWAESPNRKLLESQKKCVTVNLPALPLRVMIKLVGAAAEGQPPSELVRMASATDFTKSETMALEKWLRDVEASFGPLLPVPAVAPVAEAAAA